MGTTLALDMETFGVIGLTWRQGGAEALARFTLDRADEGPRLGALAQTMGVDELVYVATCNRVEVYFRVRELGAMAAMRGRVFRALVGRAPEPGEAERCLRAWAGEGAAEHLFLVAAGLDSAEVGETEIIGQLRRALDLAIDLDLVQSPGGRLPELFEAALKVARRVRREARLDTGRTSLAEIGIDALLTRQAQQPGPVLLVGVSPMNERCAESLRRQGVPLVLANRTRARAAALAAPGETVLDLDELRAAPPAVTAIATATAAPGHVLDRALLAALADRAAAPLLVDFATPPDADPDSARALGFTYFGMDAILAAAESTREQRLADAAVAREAIDGALDRLQAQLGDAQVAPFVAAVASHYRAVARAGAERLLSGPLADAEADVRTALLAFGDSVAKQLAHLPTTGLRGIARFGGRGAVDAFIARADPALAAAFQAALGSINTPAGLDAAAHAVRTAAAEAGPAAAHRPPTGDPRP